MASPSNPINVHDAFRFFATLDAVYEQKEPSSRVDAFSAWDIVRPKRDDRILSLIDRNIRVIENANADAEEHPASAYRISKLEIEEALSGLEKASKHPELSGKLKVVQKVIAKARKVLLKGPQYEDKLSFSGKAYNAAYTWGVDLVGSAYRVRGSDYSAAWHVHAGMQRLLGPERYMDEATGNFLYDKLLTHSDLCQRAYQFVTEAERVRAKHLELLKSPDYLIFPETEKQKLEDLYSEVDAEIQMMMAEEDDVIKDKFPVTGLFQEVFETAVSKNEQLLHDQMRVNLLDLEVNLDKLDLEKGVQEAWKPLLNNYDPQISGNVEDYKRTVISRYLVPGRKTMEKLHAYHEDCMKDGIDPDPKVLERIQKENGYVRRPPGRLKQMVNWEDRHYNASGGLSSAVRVFGFMTGSGMRREARVLLDFDQIGARGKKELTQAESIKMIDVINKMHVSLEILAHWFQAVREHPDKRPLEVLPIEKLVENIKNDPNITDDMKEKRVRRLPARLADISTLVNRMNWLTEPQKDEFLRVAIRFIYEANREYIRVLLKVGH